MYTSIIMYSKAFIIDLKMVSSLGNYQINAIKSFIQKLILLLSILVNFFFTAFSNTLNNVGGTTLFNENNVI